VLDILPLVGVTEKKTHSSSITVDEAEKVRAYARKSGAQGGSAASKARPQAEPEIKTKIDLSHISRPGDVLKAISRQQQPEVPPQSAPRAVQAPPSRATEEVRPAATTPAAP